MNVTFSLDHSVFFTQFRDLHTQPQLTGSEVGTLPREGKPMIFGNCNEGDDRIIKCKT